MKLTTALVVALGFVSALSADELAYQKPPKAILDILNAPSSPALLLNPVRTHAVLAVQPRYPSIAEVAAPMFGIGGIRIDPRNNGLHLATAYNAMTIMNVATGAQTPVQLPPKPRLSAPQWSPDSKQFAMTNTTETTIELWIVDAATGRSRRIDGVHINPLLGGAIDWMKDSRTLLVKAVPAARGPAPPEPATPRGPNVQQSLGNSGPVRTNPDMMKSPHDEALFDYYCTSQMLWLDTATGKTTPFGKPGLYSAVNESPDGNFFMVQRTHRPFSYLHAWRQFPREVAVWDKSAKPVRLIVDSPLQDRVPIGGVAVGPRAYQWRPAEPSTLLWVEALDGGNPREIVPNRDRLVALKAPFAGDPIEILKTQYRFGGIRFGENGKVAMVSDNDAGRRWQQTFLLDLATGEKKMLWARNTQDRFRDPGAAVRARTSPDDDADAGAGRGGRGGGGGRFRMDGDTILLSGAGASPEGERPFIDRYNLVTGARERLFQSSADKYEQITDILDDKVNKVLLRRESATEPPNYFIRDLAAKTEVALTKFTDPAPEFRKVTKQVVKYKRADGVPLSFTLYLPPAYKAGTRLPTIMWAYPREYNDEQTASQAFASNNRWTPIGGPSHLFLLLAGYAILDDAALPIIGDPKTVNNTYVEQLVAGAKAAIDKAVEMGVTDREKVGVSGHSYGGFMTANLLAHTDLFRAGVARSGAYNRTLTPFGFQTEQRTFWEAPEIYLRMSPFLLADKIKEPILFIHGENDNNQGTFPVQTERMYMAVSGNGGTTRMVFLPAEAHAYSARESVEHVLWETITWFDKYIKNAPPRL